jgi:CheY-like chemotaxis protein
MSKKVLAVDDDDNTTLIWEFLLSKRGYEVFKAKSSEEALDILRKEAIGFIISDLNMLTPDDGFILARAVRDDSELNKIPIILMSAMNLSCGCDDWRKQGYEAGAVGCLQKTHDHALVIEKMESIWRLLENNRR